MPYMLPEHLSLFFQQFFLVLTARFVPGQDATCSVFEAYSVQLKDIMPNFLSDLNSFVSFFQAINLSKYPTLIDFFCIQGCYCAFMHINGSNALSFFH